MKNRKFWSYSIIILKERTQEIYSRIYLSFFDSSQHFTVPLKGQEIVKLRYAL